MKVLVVGYGGREHALAWKFAQSKNVEQVYVAPGNEGMMDVAQIIPIKETDFEGLIAFAKKHTIALTFVGPEVPLSLGIVDAFEKEGLPIFGPRKNAALIEGSKTFAKELMKKYQIPTADYEAFSDYEAAQAYLEKVGAPIVIKADGLAAGKGVVVAPTLEIAQTALREMMCDEKFGKTGTKVVIEEFLEGEEFSFMALVHDELILPLTLSQDHKRACDGDKGPNTGGMGAYSDLPQISKVTTDTAMSEILIPTIAAMKDQNRSFTGVLYAGLILTDKGPKVIEFNARFGDPETQVILPRLENDLAQVILDLLNKKTTPLKWSTDQVLGIVLAATGYPDAPQKGSVINGLDELDSETLVFHSGTKKQNEQWLTNGGRVLFLARKEKTLKEAQTKVYAEAKKIQSDGLFYRHDIGWRAL